MQEPIQAPVADGTWPRLDARLPAFPPLRVAIPRETSRRAGLPIAVERSRSGNGAHVWFFFSAPVAASTARSMGCYLITATMSRRHQLGMDSYDRLFPSQDTLPRGGFGNLIALPLQRGPRRLAHSVFGDDHLVPYPDDQQWTFLASLPRIDLVTVASIALEASRRGAVIGVRAAAAELDSVPWSVPPSGRTRAVWISEPIPDRVRAVLGQGPPACEDDRRQSAWSSAIALRC